MSKSLFQKQEDQLLTKENYSVEEKKKYNDKEKRDKRKRLKKELFFHCQLWLVEIGSSVQTETEGAESYIRQM